MPRLDRAAFLGVLTCLTACTGDGGADGEGTGTAGTSGTETDESGSESGSSGSSGDETDATSDGGPDGPPCASEDDCTGDLAHCDLEHGVCTGCTTDEDCRGETLCDTATGICRDCVDDDDCDPEAPTCDAVSGQCTAVCESDQDCSGTGGPDKCDTDRGVCVDCVGNGQDCTFCELETYSCVGCLSDEDCPMNAPFCGPSLECSPACTSDDECGDLFCDPTSERCVECWLNQHCPGEICQANYTCG
jgi:hypothetical protein